MSTDFIVNLRGDDNEVVITERSARFDLDLYGYNSDAELLTLGPQQMSPDEALDLATGIIYAVWCSYQDKAEALARALVKDICDPAMAAQQRRGHHE